MTATPSQGKVVGIYIAPQRGEPTIFVEHVHVVPGRGIEGDRFFHTSNNAGEEIKPGTEITFIEQEAIDDMRNDGVRISASQTRRNIITHGVALNELVGRVFTVGTILLRGIRLCEPCDYLASRTDPGVKQSMAHRGGLRADILTDGYIHLDDPIKITN